MWHIVQKNPQIRRFSANWYSHIHIFTNILLLNPGNLSKLIWSTQLDAHELSHNKILYIWPHKYTTSDTLCKKIRKSANFPQSGGYKHRALVPLGWLGWTSYFFHKKSKHKGCKFFFFFPKWFSKNRYMVPLSLIHSLHTLHLSPHLLDPSPTLSATFFFTLFATIFNRSNDF